MIIYRKPQIIYKIPLKLMSEYTKIVGYNTIYRSQMLSYIPAMNN